MEGYDPDSAKNGLSIKSLNIESLSALLVDRIHGIGSRTPIISQLEATKKAKKRGAYPKSAARCVRRLVSFFDFEIAVQQL